MFNIFISCFYFQSNSNTVKTDNIKVVDSIEKDKYLDIITSDNIKERIIIDNKGLKEEDKSIKKNKEKNVENILLVGIDARADNFKYARADTIIVASINKSKKQIGLTSLMRDTYVKIPGHRNNRINASYAFGGIELLKKTINKNFNLNIDKHIIINFKGFEKVINILDGVYVDIKKYEIKELNRCLIGLRRSTRNFISQSGLNHLNGQQALAYCRIRRVGNGDYERTERQRGVLKSIIEKVKELKFSQYPKIIASIYPYVKTNLSSIEWLKLIYNYYGIKNWNVESMQIPTDKSGRPRKINSMWVIDPDIEECIKYIQEFIYSDCN